METFVSVATDTVLITLVLALAAFGLAIIYGLIGVINMGHGAMLTLGAYFTWWLTRHGMPFVPSVLLSAAAVGLIGLAFEHLVIRYFYNRPFDTLLLTWAFFLVATEDDQDRFRHRLPQCRQPYRRRNRYRHLPHSCLSRRSSALSLSC